MEVPGLLLASLNPATRKQAEQSLNELSTQQGFLSLLLTLVLDFSKDRAVRLSASIYLKNVIKLRWEDDAQPVSEQDKAGLRSQLVPAMTTLSDPADKSIRVQLAESVSLIAELDFPDKWPDLIDQLVAPLSQEDLNILLGSLQTSHSIFKQWRAHVRSDSLFTEINFVFSKYMEPYLRMFRMIAAMLLEPQNHPMAASPSTYSLLAENMVLMIEIYYDFTCQDLPPAIEDSNLEFFGPEGWFHRFLVWQSPQLAGDEDDPSPSLQSQIKTATLEIAELFLKLYNDQYQLSNAGTRFVQDIWALLGSNTLTAINTDQLVSQSLHFISTAIRCGYYKDLFASRDTITSLVQGVVIPNVSLRDHELEQFEDDPLEFIRSDLSLHSAGDPTTRRHSAADIVQALVASGFEKDTTEIVSGWIAKGLQEYSTNKSENWKAKDSSVFLMTAIATKGTTTQSGVTAINALVDVIKFFSDNVYGDLQDTTAHPILQVDAIRFLYTFRNQLTKPQLLSVLPLLVQHIRSGNYVACTYAAITIDRVLFIKHENKLLFAQADVHDFAQDLVDTLLTKIASAGAPEKLAENDHLMKCIMRVIITARQTFIPTFTDTLNKLVGILGVISRNPSNPRFDQYIFESISGLMRFVVQGNPATLAVFEQTLFEPFTIILQQDIDQYIPYVFQILAQMLDLHTTDIPDGFRNLLPFLLTPPIWQQKGSVPGLVRLLKAYLARDGRQMLAAGQIAAVLAIVQQRLIPSKTNDVWGFELIQAVLRYVPPTGLQQYFKAVIMTVLTRMHTSRTDAYVQLFSKFTLYALAIQADGLSPDYLISTVEDIQAGLWTQLLNNVVIPQTVKLPHKERKLAVVGLIRLLTESNVMIQEPHSQAWPTALSSLIRLFSEPQYLARSTADEEAENVGFTQVDYEEQTAGYQAAYSRLAASESVEADPVEYVTNPQEFVGQKLVAFANAQPVKARLLFSAGDPAIVQPFIATMAAAGYSLNL